MRAIAFVAALVISSPAYADNFVEIVGGLMNPVEDDDWKDLVDESFKLGVRVGSIKDKLGGMLSIDWTPINDDKGWQGPFGGSIDVSAHRFRVLANAAFHAKAARNLIASARIGGGIDITHVNIRQTLIGTSETDDTDAGVALELGGGLWFQVGSMQVGGELGIPMSFHADDNQDDIDMNDYNSIDLDLLFGVRFTTD